MRGGWSKTRTARLKMLWRRGETATAISAALGGVSRSAILGKVFRLRLAPVDDPAVLLAKRHAGRPPIFGRQAPLAPSKTSKLPSAVAKARRLSLFDLKNENCRWLGN